MRNRSGRRLPNFLVGAIMLAVLAVGAYMAFTKNVPWGGGTDFKVVFKSAQNLRKNAPIRIAGVTVGEVKSVEPLDPSADPADGADASSGSVQSGAVAEIELDDAGLPLKEDATFTLRPRLFLEGNLFVDVRPGSPSAPVVDAGYSFPPQQTTNSVQLDEVLSGVLQADSRKDLAVFLDQFGTALIDARGASSLRALNRASPGAFRFTSEVNQAVLGENPHDLSSLIANLGKVVRGLNSSGPSLPDLVTNLRITAGSLAAQSDDLERAIQLLPGTLEAGNNAFVSLNNFFPPTRAFAREALSGVKSTPATLDAATPLLRQLRLLSRPQELRGLVSDLRPTVPNLAQLTRRTIPFLEQTRALSSCFNHTILPFANDRIDGGPTYNADHGPEGRVFEETGYGLAGINGESRNFDSNGEYIRVIGGGGTNTVQTQDQSTGETLAGVTPFPIAGAMPPLSASAKTPFRPDIPCETQDPPDLSAVPGTPPQQQSAPAGGTPTGTAGRIAKDSQTTLKELGEATQAAKDGDKPQAKSLGRRAMKDLANFYESYGSGN